MKQQGQKESTRPTPSQQNRNLTAKTRKAMKDRVCQADIFCDLKVIEDVCIDGSTISVSEISFPYLVCLSQECDLERDYEQESTTGNEYSIKSLMHITFAPAFIFEDFLSGEHWGQLFGKSEAAKRKDTKIKAIISNDTARYHYLSFDHDDKVKGRVLPELVIDFKHYYTINRNVVYKNLDNRLCSMGDLFREKISQRFSYFISRIGLPEY